MRCRWLVIALFACSKHARVEPAPSGEQVAIVVVDPGATAEELETSVAEPVEHAASQVAHVARMRTTIADGRVKVELELDGEGDALAASQDVQTHLQAVLRELPRDVSPPTILAEAPQVTALRYTLRSDTLPRAQLTAIDEELVREPLESTFGVLRIDGCGGQRARWVVEVDAGRLAAAGLALRDVERGVSAANLALPGGPQLTLEQLADLAVSTRNGAVVRLRDVAALREDGEPAACRAYDERGAVISGVVRVHRNTADEARDKLAAAVAHVHQKLPPAVTLDLLPDDASELAIDSDDGLDVARAIEQLRAVRGVQHVLAADDGERTRITVFPRAAAPEAVHALRMAGHRVHARDEVIVQILGADRGKLVELARAAADALRAHTGVALTGGVSLTEHATLQLVLDHDAAARIGVSSDEAIDALRAASEQGLPAATRFDGHTPRPIVIRMPGREQLMQTYVHGATGMVPVAAIARAETKSGVTEIRRDNGERWVGVSASGDPDAIRDAVAKLALPAGYHIRFVAGGP